MRMAEGVGEVEVLIGQQHIIDTLGKIKLYVMKGKKTIDAYS